MPDQLFITGMFRSGTTLLARMLDAHEHIACASDPFSPFFKHFRNDIADEVGADIDPAAPFGSYYGDFDELELFEAIEGASLERSFTGDHDALLERIRERGRPFSPILVDRLDSLEGDNYRAAYDDLRSNVLPAYGTGNEAWAGTKETWLTELVPSLAEADSSAKFVLVVRDPRAVTASKNVNEDSKYPWLFLLRQWRKLAGLAWTYANDPGLSDRVYLLRFEDLVTEPERTGRELCDFLDIPLDKDVLDPSTFTDGSGEQWLQNTSYENSKAEFNTDSVDKWKQIHPDRIVRYVEQLCYADMELFGYDCSEANRLVLDGQYLYAPPTVGVDSMAEWIQPYYRDRTPVSHRNDVAIELVRQELLRAPEEGIADLDTRVIESYFLKVKYARALRRSTQNEDTPIGEGS